LKHFCLRETILQKEKPVSDAGFELKALKLKVLKSAERYDWHHLKKTGTTGKFPKKFDTVQN
jgi:hypothetical protein